ncbi:MAG: hypothetical protein J6R07_01080, partial [Bacteroidaceae bacterium]|nr:hypothetical protein [Bacteroidaceae bacterium]
NRGGGPQGGPKDTTPPKLLKCTPENGATNVSMVPLMDNCGNTAHCECRKEDIMEAFDFYTNR